jgi:coenzyme F420-0:L-glutamate ligase/coenzyme F420-1:gamma-L-glutamate ligase
MFVGFNSIAQQQETKHCRNVAASTGIRESVARLCYNRPPDGEKVPHVYRPLIPFPEAAGFAPKSWRRQRKLPEPGIRVLPIKGIPEIHPGDNLGTILAEALQQSGIRVAEWDVVVIAQKIVSKAEGRIARLDSIEPSEKAKRWADEHHKDARLVELVLQQARRVIRMERGVLIVETHHGFVCANAGVDASNAPPGTATLLPEDPDRTARELAAQFSTTFGIPIAVIISDTFGRPWREGLTNVAIGVAGIAPLMDYRGQRDSSNRPLQATVIALADELASAAELVMGKLNGVPAAIVQGFQYRSREGSGRDLLRAPDQDLFR